VVILFYRFRGTNVFLTWFPRVHSLLVLCEGLFMAVSGGGSRASSNNTPKGTIFPLITSTPPSLGSLPSLSS